MGYCPKKMVFVFFSKWFRSYSAVFKYCIRPSGPIYGSIFSFKLINDPENKDFTSILEFMAPNCLLSFAIKV